VKSLEEELAGVRKASDEAAAKAKEEVQRLKTEVGSGRTLFLYDLR
jgi:hypothetical protein